jgi:outer membrane protein OmpA-like peptidoglycan-associated protein
MRTKILLAMSAVVVLTLGGCSTKGGSSRTTDVESGKTDGSTADASKRGGASGTPGSGDQPLTGFTKKPADETVPGSGPLTLSKADPQSQESLESQRKLRGDKRQTLADVYFAFDRWGLTEDGKKDLVQSAEYLRSHPAAKLLIEGYCDERGSREYNLALGQKRADETRAFLTDLGIRNPIAVTSYGKERPVCEERDESCYWKNRRAHLLIQNEP